MTLVATFFYHVLPFFLNWFKSKDCNILPALSCRLPQHSEQFFLPFRVASANALD